jgi:hypothetical protein
MTSADWVSVGEFDGVGPASLAAAHLDEHGIPCKVMSSGLVRDRARFLWVPPERAEEAKAVLATDEVPEDELAKEALSFPPPDDV